MTDSESDRRDAIRRQIVQTCVGKVLDTIRENGVTTTAEERRYLEIEVATKLLNGIRLEAMSMMMRCEIHTIEWCRVPVGGEFCRLPKGHAGEHKYLNGD